MLAKSLWLTVGQILLQGEDITAAPLHRLREQGATCGAVILP